MGLLGCHPLTINCCRQECQKVQVAQCLRGPGGEAAGGELEAIKQREGVVGLWLVDVLWYLLETQPDQVPQAAAVHFSNHCVKEGRERRKGK